MGFHDERGVYHPFYGRVPFKLAEFRICSSGADVGAIAVASGNGGQLASDTAPTLSGSGSLITQELTWIASNSTPICSSADLPADFDGRSSVQFQMLVASSGTTNPASFTVATSWDGGATVSDTFTDVAAITYHWTTCIIDKADIPDEASTVSLLLTPAAHTTDTMLVRAVRILYVPRIG